MKANFKPSEDMPKTTECILVGFDYTNGVDKSVLIVGRQPKGKPVEILNAFQGTEAEELWRKLTVKEEKTDGN